MNYMYSRGELVYTLNILACHFVGNKSQNPCVIVLTQETQSSSAPFPRSSFRVFVVTSRVSPKITAQSTESGPVTRTFPRDVPRSVRLNSSLLTKPKPELMCDRIESSHSWQQPMSTGDMRCAVNHDVKPDCSGQGACGPDVLTYPVMECWSEGFVSQNATLGHHSYPSKQLFVNPTAFPAV